MVKPSQRIEEWAEDPSAEGMFDLALEEGSEFANDEFAFRIDRKTEDDKAPSAEAMDATFAMIKAWVGGRMMAHWRARGVAPKHMEILISLSFDDRTDGQHRRG
jgi:hypothetical protein